MLVHRFEIMILDHSNMNVEQIKDELEYIDCFHVSVVKTDTREIEDWTDDHPLNKNVGWKEEYERIFSDGCDKLSEREIWAKTYVK